MSQLLSVHLVLRNVTSAAIMGSCASKSQCPVYVLQLLLLYLVMRNVASAAMMVTCTSFALCDSHKCQQVVCTVRKL